MIAGRDLAAPDPAAAEPAVSAALADLAAGALEAALAIARSELPAGSAPCRLAVIGMGKCGGRELNYVSDVDVIFVAEPVAGSADGDEQAALATGAKLAAGLTRACSEATAEGTLWPVDAALRPEGKAGPLVRTLASHLAYYQRWATTWEFQALLKARPVAGDLRARAGLRRRDPPAGLAGGRAPELRRGRAGHAPPGRGARPAEGGRAASSSSARAACATSSSPSSCSSSCTAGPTRLRSGTRWRRSRRWPPTATSAATTPPRSTAPTASCARSSTGSSSTGCGAPTSCPTTRPTCAGSAAAAAASPADPARALETEWHRHAREVRRLHEKLFYRPLLAAVGAAVHGRGPAHARGGRAPGSPRSATRDPAGALRHLEALTGGVSRRAAIQRHAAAGDARLVRRRPRPRRRAARLPPAVARRWARPPGTCSCCATRAAAAERLAHVLVVEPLRGRPARARAPEAVALLGDDDELEPRPREVSLAAVGKAMAAARGDDPRRPPSRCAPCAAASCSGPPSPTWPGCSSRRPSGPR